MPTKERNGYLDFVKGFAIFLVIFGHALQYGSGDSFLTQELYWDDPLMKAIYSVHMPLFAAVSGYFYWFGLNRRGPIKAAWNKIQQFLPVCIVWGTILWIAHGAAGKGWGLKTLIRLCITDYWFLWTIMIASVVVSFVQWTAQERRVMRVMLYEAACAVAFLTPDTYWFNAHKFMLGYFVMGFFYGKYGCSWLQKPVAMLVSVAAWCAMIPFYTRVAYIYLSGFTLMGKENWLKQLGIDIYRFAVGAAGVVMLLCLLKKLYEKMRIGWFFGAIRKVGERSLSIYILSTYIFTDLLPYLTQNAEVNYLLTLLESVVMLAFCCAVGSLLQRSKMAARLLLGCKY